MRRSKDMTRHALDVSNMVIFLADGGGGPHSTCMSGTSGHQHAQHSIHPRRQQNKALFTILTHCEDADDRT